MAEFKITKPDDDSIRASFGAVFQPDIDPMRNMMEWTWFRNVLYYLGEQWLSWFESTGSFGRRYNFNTAIPTPVSNIIRDFVRSSKSLTLNKKFNTSVWPNSHDKKDIDAAAAGTALLHHMDSLNDGEIADIKEHTAMWRTLSGNGFVRVFPDLDTGRFVINQKTSEVMSAPAEVGVEPVLPFNVLVDPIGDCLKKKGYVGIKTLVRKEWVEDTFKVKISGNENLMEVDYQRQLMSLVANVSPWKGRGYENFILEDPKDDFVVYKELEFRPTKEFPKGRYQVMAGDDVIVNDVKMLIPVDKDTGAWNYSLTHFPYNFTPGSFWSTGGVDDLISPQNIINEIDQALATNRKSLGRPFVLTPSDVVLKRLSEKGQSILSIEYNGRESLGARPIIQPGTPYPNQILDERDNQRGVAQDASGDPKNVLRGNIPTSKASGILVDILRETAEQSHTPDVERFYRNWNEVDKKRLILAQDVYKETRIIKVMGEGHKHEIRKFKGADLRNNTDVRYEPDFGLASTNAGKVQVITQLVQGGFFGDLQTQPEVRRELMKRIGLGNFPEDENLHMARVEREHSAIRAGEVAQIALPNMPMINPQTGQPVLDNNNRPMTMFPLSHDPIFRLDPHQTHVFGHDQMIFSPEFMEWPEESQIMLIAHRDFHMATIESEQQGEIQNIMQEAGMGPEGQPEPEEPSIVDQMVSETVGV
jgi:hypothetical protein